MHIYVSSNFPFRSLSSDFTTHFGEILNIQVLQWPESIKLQVCLNFDEKNGPHAYVCVHLAFEGPREMGLEIIHYVPFDILLVTGVFCVGDWGRNCI